LRWRLRGRGIASHRRGSARVVRAHVAADAHVALTRVLQHDGLLPHRDPGVEAPGSLSAGRHTDPHHDRALADTTSLSRIARSTTPARMTGIGITMGSRTTPRHAPQTTGRC
jgi:hypothetical protein